MTRTELIERPNLMSRPHVVLLGAGASLAAFPNGDKSSNPIPLMNNLVATLNLHSLLERAGELNDVNFESVYSKLAANPRCEEIRREVETRVNDYFSSLELPLEATIYDQLLLSLRPGDAVFTFNWDPFLFDSYKRNYDVAELPEVFFLHGNVRIGVCGYTEICGGNEEIRARTVASHSMTCLCFTLSRKRGTLRVPTSRTAGSTHEGSSKRRSC